MKIAGKPIKDPELLKEIFDEIKSRDITCFVITYLYTRTLAQINDILSMKVEDLLGSSYAPPRGIEYVYSKDFIESICEMLSKRGLDVSSIDNYSLTPEELSSNAFLTNGGLEYTAKTFQKNMNYILTTSGYEGNLSDFQRTGLYDYFKMHGTFPDIRGAISLRSNKARCLQYLDITDEEYINISNKNASFNRLSYYCSVFALYDDKDANYKLHPIRYTDYQTTIQHIKNELDNLYARMSKNNGSCYFDKDRFLAALDDLEEIKNSCSNIDNIIGHHISNEIECYAFILQFKHHDSTEISFITPGENIEDILGIMPETYDYLIETETCDYIIESEISDGRPTEDKHLPKLELWSSTWVWFESKEDAYRTIRELKKENERKPPEEQKSNLELLLESGLNIVSWPETIDCPFM